MPVHHLGHEPLCPVGTCHSCGVRRYAIRKPRSHKPGGVPARWSPTEDRIIRDGSGVLTFEEMQAAIFRETGVERTENAIISRMKRIGIPQALPGRTISQVSYMLGARYGTVQGWVKCGLLGPPNRLQAQATIRDEDLERFVREHTDLYDRLRIRSSSLRSIADAVWNRDPWLNVGQVALLISRSKEYVRQRIVSGEISGHLATGQRNGHPRWLVRRSEVVRYFLGRAHGIGPYGHQDGHSAVLPLERGWNHQTPGEGVPAASHGA